jgi:hypothetical protein
VFSFTPRPLYPREIAPGSHWLGGWVDPRAGLDNFEKKKILILPGLELDPSSVQPTASRYTDYSIQLFETVLVLVLKSDARKQLITQRKGLRTEATHEHQATTVEPYRFDKWMTPLEAQNYLILRNFKRF